MEGQLHSGATAGYRYCCLCAAATVAAVAAARFLLLSSIGSFLSSFVFIVHAAASYFSKLIMWCVTNYLQKAFLADPASAEDA